MPNIFTRFKTGWNAFLGRDPTIEDFPVMGDAYTTGSRPDRRRFTGGNQRTIVAAVYNRISVDVSEINIEHAKLDEDGNFKETVNSDLNNCLTTEANVDQTGRAFIQDLVQSMFDEGVVAVVPTDTDIDPDEGSYKIFEMRTGKIIGWYPYDVKVRVYNEAKGRQQDIIVPKSETAIIENPFYAVMNEPNSTLQRLIRTIARLDDINFQSTSGRLDLIIQLPYIIKTEQRRKEAEKRRQDIEDQLTNTKYGIAYTDGTERITQLNRSIENNLWDQVKDLTEQLYNQLGLSQAIIDGTADEQATINYYNNTIAPICRAITDEFSRKFLTKTARTQRHTIVYYRDPFKLVPVSNLADIADKFRRNEIMTSNEIRGKIGLKPSDANQADTLRNPNLNASAEQLAAEGSIPASMIDGEESGGDAQNVANALAMIGNQSVSGGNEDV